MANKTKIVHVAIEPEALLKLKALAKQCACPVSYLVRQAISNYLIQAAVR